MARAVAVSAAVASAAATVAVTAAATAAAATAACSEAAAAAAAAKGAAKGAAAALGWVGREGAAAGLAALAPSRSQIVRESTRSCHSTNSGLAIASSHPTPLFLPGCCPTCTHYY